MMDLNFWIERYLERTRSFIWTFQKNFNIDDPIEEVIVEDLLIYLYDNDIPFTQNPQKKRSWPDVEILHCTLDVMIILPWYSPMDISDKLEGQLNEDTKQANEQPRLSKIIFIYNLSKSLVLKPCEENKERLKIFNCRGEYPADYRRIRREIKLGPPITFVPPFE